MAVGNWQKLDDADKILRYYQLTRQTNLVNIAHYIKCKYKRRKTKANIAESLPILK